MPKEKHRVIIDTNLWISFLLVRDYSKIDQILITDRTTILISHELLEEVVEVAQRTKFRKYFNLTDLTELLVKLRQYAELVQVTSEIAICRDDKDNFLLSLAVDGNATHILTGDKDLLVLHPFGDVQIQTISEYLSNE